MGRESSGRRRGWRRAAGALLVAGTLGSTAPAIGAQEGGTVASSRPPLSADLTDIAFLAGCWAGRMGPLDVREQWSEPEAGAMLGTTRYFRDGRLADFEFGMFVETDGGVWLWPYPRGERSVDGFALVSMDGEYVFENLEHDFPVRIVYVRDGDDLLTPRIEGTDGNGPAWSLARVACPGG